LGEGGRVTCWVLYGKYGTKYPVRYYVSEDKGEFTIYVRHNIDGGVEISGGVDKELCAIKHVEENSEEISID